ncbi:carbon-nitrogen hydrolase [Stratiformator vulcanicus]|uniref:N-carbamoyl-D-amino acid hydrolase n=1 Tax=Stratiformator vulcanicus TaxID=2527980 RepID=A0A517R052_9PLAN|nr:carbon-nitrogen hydrolase [Stratiformator vulcanicus]QDT37213.1 N-carbamoyl-D-amino acid hydrolase [Stratiformator vulcanicus]
MISGGHKQGQTRLALVQMRCSANPDENLDRAVQFVKQAASDGAEVVCLPELFRSRYFCQSEDHRNFDLAESIPGPSTQRLGSIAREAGIIVLASLFERRAAGLYHNTLAVIGTDGEVAGLYRKMHIPDDPFYYEKFYFTPGDLGFRSFATKFGNIGTLVCWDQWYPEAARLTALAGAEVIFYPTAIGWHPSEKAEFGEAQHDAWETIQRSHAIANGCYVASVNRIGHEPAPEGSGGEGIEFWGQTFLAGPDGHIIAKAPANEETILHATIDRDRIDVHRTHWPFLRDRRIDAYGDIERRWRDT